MAARRRSRKRRPADPHALVNRDLRTDFVEAYGARVFLALSTVASIFLLPFSIHNFLNQHYLLGSASALVAICLMTNATALARGREAPFPPVVLFAPVLAALAIAMYQQGLIGILWSYAAILLFHFVLPRLTANIFNGIIVALAIPMSWIHLGPAITARVAVTLLLTLLFTNIFSYLTDAQRRKEAEHRRRLDSAQQDLLRSHEQVQQQAAQLERQNQALREAMRVREEVERIARHDIKSPIASIAAVPRMLRRDRTLSAKEEELLGLVEGAALRVLSMVNLSLDLYRMEEGTYRARAQAVDLVELVKTAVQEIRAHAESKRIRVEVHALTGPLRAHAEELLCFSIVGNLLKNAVEAAPEDSVVTVSVRAFDDGAVPLVVLQVHNLGAVPTEVRNRFFQKYATAGKPGGTGLGAYSARLMARVQHGDLEMMTGDDAGTTLTLSLPRVVEQPFAPSLHPDHDETSPASQPFPESTLPGLRLLLVDDDPYNVMVLRGLLPVPPLEVDSAINGRAALQKIAQDRFDIIFLDLQMPVMGGLEAVRRIRQLQESRGEPASMVVAFSARDDEASRRECEEAGFDRYLVKPASRSEVLGILAEVQPLPASVVHVDHHVDALMPQFIESRREILKRLEGAAAREDREQVRVLSHQLAGSLAMYGFRAASQFAADLERRCGSISQADLPHQCARLAAQFERDSASLLSNQAA